MEELIQAPGADIAAIDAGLKRYRRVKVVRALKGLSVDIYGRGWEQYVEGCGFKLLTPEPNHNAMFGTLCQGYAGVVNFDPNFGVGTNERAMTALATGTRLMNNSNSRIGGMTGVYTYSFGDEPAKIRSVAERMFTNVWTESKMVTGYGWEEGVGRVLKALGPLDLGRGSRASYPVHWHYDVPWNRRGVEAVTC